MTVNPHPVGTEEWASHELQAEADRRATVDGWYGGSRQDAHLRLDREAADGSALLDELREFIARYVAFPTRAALDAVTLWAAHAHLVDEFDSTPRLALLSPEPGSGKTRTLEVLELLVPRGMHALGASAAAVFRSIEAERPTLLFDEVDAIFRRSGKDDSAEDLRAILNSGHRRGATVPRCVGPRHEVARFPVYAAAALAGLGDLPDTLMTRSVVIPMRRRAPGERVEPFRHRVVAPAGHALRDRLRAWADEVASAVREAWPEMPPGVTDRPADVWEPLLAVADAAGGHWPATARAACTAFCTTAVDRGISLGVRLLIDLRTVFGESTAMSTAEILTQLHKIDESPWGDLRGQPLNARGLATRLRGYEVRSIKINFAGVSLQGYRAEDLYDTWSRYLPPASDDLPPGDPPDPELPEPAERRSSQGVLQVPDGFRVPEPHRDNGFAPRGAVPEPHPDPEPESVPLTCAVPQVPAVPDLGGEPLWDQYLRER